MKTIVALLTLLLTGCATQYGQLQDRKAENDAAQYQISKREICDLSYTSTVIMFEGDLTTWQAYCQK